MRLFFSAFPILLASMALLGWAMGDRDMGADFIAREPIAGATALSLFILGMTSALWSRFHLVFRGRVVAEIAIALVILSAAFSLWHGLVHSYFGISLWPTNDTASNFWVAALIMSPSTSLTLLLLGPALLLMLRVAAPVAAGQHNNAVVRHTIILGQSLAVLSALIALYVLISYLYETVSLNGFSALSPMPRVAAIALFSLSLAVLAIYPDRGLVRFIANDGPSGEMAQFLLPVSVCVPIGLGWLRIIGIRAHLYDATFGLDLTTMLNVVLLGSLTLVSARKLYRSDQKAKAVEQELIYRATHDSMTGLVNRAVFREQLTRRLRIAERRRGAAFAVFYLDLDGFKQVNDVLGHDAGDKLLMQVADMLRSCTRVSDTVARFGGDEFVILLEEIENPEAAIALAERILNAMPRGFGDGSEKVKVGISIGIATSEDGHLTPDDMLREADMALHKAKSGGKCRYEVAGQVVVSARNRNVS